MAPGFAIAIAGWFGWLAGRLLQAAVSRQREFLADARAVQFTRSKEGLGGVLRKVQRLQRGGADFEGRNSQEPALAERIRRIYGRTMPVLPNGQTDNREAAFANTQPL